MGRQWILLAIILGLVCSHAISVAESPTTAQPFESAAWSTPGNVIDTAVVTALGKQGVRLRNPCSDEVFIRRVYLDAIGTLPTPAEVDAFLAENSPDKRATLIDSLLLRNEFQRLLDDEVV